MRLLLVPLLAAVAFMPRPAYNPLARVVTLSASWNGTFPTTLGAAIRSIVVLGLRFPGFHLKIFLPFFRVGTHFDS